MTLEEETSRLLAQIDLAAPGAGSLVAQKYIALCKRYEGPSARPVPARPSVVVEMGPPSIYASPSLHTGVLRPNASPLVAAAHELPLSRDLLASMHRLETRVEQLHVRLEPSRSSWTKKIALTLGLAFLSASTVRYWMDKFEPVLQHPTPRIAAQAPMPRNPKPLYGAGRYIPPSISTAGAMQSSASQYHAPAPVNTPSSSPSYGAKLNQVDAILRSRK